MNRFPPPETALTTARLAAAYCLPGHTAARYRAIIAAMDDPAHRDRHLTAARHWAAAIKQAEDRVNALL